MPRYVGPPHLYDRDVSQLIQTAKPHFPYRKKPRTVRIIRPEISESPEMRIRYVKHHMGRGQAFRQSAPRIAINPQIQALLAKPTWSVGSLLAPKGRGRDGSAAVAVAGRSATAAPTFANEKNNQVADEADEEEEITPEKLRHLLKLSALPPPKDAAEEQDMLNTLRQQIHFVKEIQKVDTTGVEPLVAIRDETVDGIWNNTITEETLEPYFQMEEHVGENGTIRRRKEVVPNDVNKDDMVDDPAEPLTEHIMDDSQIMKDQDHTVDDHPAEAEPEPLRSDMKEDPHIEEGHIFYDPAEPLPPEMMKGPQLRIFYTVDDPAEPMPSQIMEDPFDLSTEDETEKGRRIGRYFYVRRQKNRNQSQESRAESTTSPD
ncbi:hypothetical protein PV10_01693 [Exophiala mesophila]|uniref:Glutamyl-tRNA amidotransferase complex subunit Gta3 domain-containing protein n=1 Tax=Exophiala mesophila TaxID=212818 RepID=A0A0D1ZVL3_EXOME|nr:uncharacterized protein PV10_01693 [Exophiala mesophila]KIV97999.1 hypothetical protein PV10_01693 [Exophiala mesophila]